MFQGWEADKERNESPYCAVRSEDHLIKNFAVCDNYVPDFLTVKSRNQKASISL